MINDSILTIFTDDSTLEGAHELTLKVQYPILNGVFVDATMMIDFRLCEVRLDQEKWILEDFHVPAYSPHSLEIILKEPPTFSYVDVFFCNYKW